MDVQNRGVAAAKKRILVRLPFLLLIPLGFALPKIAARFPWDVERVYSSGVYPSISYALNRFSSLFGFSAAELFIVLLITGTLFLTVFNVVRLIKKSLHPLKFISFLLSVAILAGALLCAFYLCWGLNYFRPTLYQLMELDVRERDKSELYSLTKALAARANELSIRVPRNEEGVFDTGGYREYFSRIPAAYDELAKVHDIFKGHTAVAKGVTASKAMSWAGISGIYIPYTAEPNVNVHQPSLLMLSTAAHESAHYKGFAKEDEANFIACLACSCSDDDSIAYSGVMLSLIHCGNKLYASDPEAYKDIYAAYTEEVIRDIRSYNAYWDSYEGEVEETFDAINDNYLKFNQQQEGIKSYGLMVDLMLAYAEKYGI